MPVSDFPSSKLRTGVIESIGGVDATGRDIDGRDARGGGGISGGRRGRPPPLSSSALGDLPHLVADTDYDSSVCAHSNLHTLSPDTPFQS